MEIGAVELISNSIIVQPVPHALTLTMKYAPTNHIQKLANIFGKCDWQYKWQGMNNILPSSSGLFGTLSDKYKKSLAFEMK